MMLTRRKLFASFAGCLACSAALFAAHAAELFRRAEIEQAIREIKAMRKRAKPVAVEEILVWRDEGRK